MKREVVSVIGIACALGLTWNIAFTAEKANAPSANADEYFHAIRANDLKTLQQLVAAGSANVRDSLDSTPLHYAALYGSVESVRLLLSAGADANAACYCPRTRARKNTK
jgi:hypothetical protein